MNNFWQNLPKPFLVLAPMENVTDFVFREIVATKLPRPDVFFTEFTNVVALNSDGYEKTIHRFKFSEHQRPIVAQIWGTDLDSYVKAAQLIQQLGFDGIDINMGCPDRSVMKTGAGSALVDNPLLAKEIIAATKSGAPHLPISVKTRIGTKEIVTESWITFLLQQNIDALTIHGRTAKQLSEVPASWEEIAQAVKMGDSVAPETIIVGNGDVTNYKEAQTKAAQFGVDGVMIGRGIFANPWVFENSDNQTHTPEEHQAVLIEHLKLYDSVYQGSHHYDVMKKFFKMYINNFDGASQLRTKLMATKNISEALSILTQVN